MKTDPLVICTLTLICIRNENAFIRRVNIVEAMAMSQHCLKNAWNNYYFSTKKKIFIQLTMFLKYVRIRYMTDKEQMRDYFKTKYTQPHIGMHSTHIKAWLKGQQLAIKLVVSSYTSRQRDNETRVAKINSQHYACFISPIICQLQSFCLFY